MDASAPCRMSMNMLFLLVAHHRSSPQTADAAFPHVVPSRHQHFEHESVSFNCNTFDESAEWRVLRKIRGSVAICTSSWRTSAGPCTITSALVTDSGRYWCEAAGGERSSSVNIMVTTGSVILESPVGPVTEGGKVTLRCRNKKTSSDLQADFFKDGFLMQRSSTGDVTIHNVSTSDEAFYKCSISGAGESPTSLMSVRGGAVVLESPVLPVMEGHAVTLHCRNMNMWSSYIAEFYKDGSPLLTGYDGSMTISNVSKSDEGLYMCSIYGVGESLERWLAVGAFQEVVHPSHECSPGAFIVLRIIGTILLVALGLVVGLQRCRTKRSPRDT